MKGICEVTNRQSNYIEGLLFDLTKNTKIPIINKYDQLNIVLNGAQCATAACPNRMDPPTSQLAPNTIEKVEIVACAGERGHRDKHPYIRLGSCDPT